MTPRPRSRSSRLAARTRCASTSRRASSSRGCSTCRPSTCKGSAGSSPCRPTPSSSARRPTCAPRSTRRRSTTSARRSRSSRTSSPTPTSATGCSATSASTWTALIYEREPAAFKYPYAFDVPLDSWHELVMANALYDQAGFVLLSDVHASSTFGPWKRALAKVDKEETFHLRHGRTWVKKLCADPDEKARSPGAPPTGCSSSRSSGSGCPTSASGTASSSSTASRA